MDQIVKFAKHQKLPTGYKIEWWEGDEHYHWVINENTYSCAFSSRWQAFRNAWAHSMTAKHTRRRGCNNPNILASVRPACRVCNVIGRFNLIKKWKELTD